MYVCVCKGITDKQIREAIGAGATEMKSLCDEFALGSQCGTCCKMTKEILTEELDNSPSYYEVA